MWQMVSAQQASGPRTLEIRGRRGKGAAGWAGHLSLFMPSVFSLNGSVATQTYRPLLSVFGFGQCHQEMFPQVVALGKCPHPSASLLTSTTSTPALRHFESCLNYTFASDPYAFWGTWTSGKDTIMIAAGLYIDTERDREKGREGRRWGGREGRTGRETHTDRHTCTHTVMVVAVAAVVTVKHLSVGLFSAT